MTSEHYMKIIKECSYPVIGKALGMAIKDPDINPNSYSFLCRMAIEKGFSFRYIAFA